MLVLISQSLPIELYSSFNTIPLSLGSECEENWQRYVLCVHKSARIRSQQEREALHDRLEPISERERIRLQTGLCNLLQTRIVFSCDEVKMAGCTCNSILIGITRNSLQGSNFWCPVS